MNFSHISNQTLIGKGLRLPLKLIPKRMVIPIMQGPLRGKLWVVGSSSHGCWLGSYELQKQQIFIKTVRPRYVVYDIGAHVGFYTLLSSVLVGSQGKVLAFEPVPRNLQYLRRHVHMNCCPNVSVSYHMRFQICLARKASIPRSILAWVIFPKRVKWK